uniref:Zinc finger protein-like 1 homolog n=1 Tax=Angiostrongylus cantonensis TaxID=6313 RepID=A0A0K0CWU0_ANGCA
MGLCKCPRKKVTNLFCFEHRVNVCEHCLVENHHDCVVQSYLQWLTDCDFDTNCPLCEKSLAEAETIRLQCLHLLHWSCLDQWAQRFPATTAPAGYCCPFCREALFPAINQTSPMIDELRAKLQQANWARAGLGMPLLPEMSSSMPYQPHNTSNVTQKPIHLQNGLEDGKTRKKYAGASELDIQPLLAKSNDGDADSEQNKYKRRPAREWLRGIWNAKYGNSSQKQFTGCKLVLIAVFFFILLITVIVLTNAGTGADNDPLLDPMNNPNIRVAIDGIGNSI